MSAANVVAATTASNILGGLGNCIYDSGSNRIVLTAININTDLSPGTACSFDLVIDGSVPVPTALAIEIFGTPGCNTTTPGSCTTTVVDVDASTAGVQAHVSTTSNAPAPYVLNYAPPAGSTVTFTAGAAPGTAAPDEMIAVTASGNTGTASLTGCAISGAGASAFSVSPTSLTFNAAVTQNLTVGCSYPTSNATATLSCTETDGDTAAPGAARTWNLNCPAPAVAPTVTSPTASPLSVSAGIVGAQGTALIDLSATGGSGTGSTAVSCTSTGTVLIAAAPAAPAGQGPVTFNVVGTAQPSDIRVGVPLTAAAQPNAGTVTCTVAGQPDIVIAVSAPAGTTVVPPQFIPSSSTWSAIALLSLLGVFGLLAVGFRRQG
ncbi:MAG: hypothetical protein WCZ65_04340 [Lysobacteraceae bacterium]